MTIGLLCIVLILSVPDCFNLNSVIALWSSECRLSDWRKEKICQNAFCTTSFYSTAAEPIHPQELMVYKVLERLGFGCETHFLQRSFEDVYIATLDVGHGGCFSTFAKATGGAEKVGDEVMAKLYGAPYK